MSKSFVYSLNYFHMNHQKHYRDGSLFPEQRAFPDIRIESYHRHIHLNRTSHIFGWERGKERGRKRTEERNTHLTDTSCSSYTVINVQIPPNYPKLGAQNAPSARVSVPMYLSEPEHLIPLYIFKESHFEIHMACIKKPTSLSVVHLTKEWL